MCLYFWKTTYWPPFTHPFSQRRKQLFCQAFDRLVGQASSHDVGQPDRELEMWSVKSQLIQSGGKEVVNLYVDNGKDYTAILTPYSFSLKSQGWNWSAKWQPDRSCPVSQRVNKPVSQQPGRSLSQSMTQSTRQGSVRKAVSINCGERCTQWLCELIQKWASIIMLLYLPLQFPSSLSGKFNKPPFSKEWDQKLFLTVTCY